MTKGRSKKSRKRMEEISVNEREGFKGFKENLKRKIVTIIVDRIIRVHLPAGSVRTDVTNVQQPVEVWHVETAIVQYLIYSYLRTSNRRIDHRS